MCQRIALILALIPIITALAACSDAPSVVGATPSRETDTPAATLTTVPPTAVPTRTSTATLAPPSPSSTATATPTETATATPTPDPYAAITIDGLTARAYGEGEITVTEALGENADFGRYLITYPSDELTIHGFVNVPRGEGPFPVVIVLHGYIPPERYSALAYTTRYADALARAGYVAIHPNLRNFPPSDTAPDALRVGGAIDALNLVGLVRRHAGQSGLLETADGERIGMWGHSMGGGITIRAITVDSGIRAAVLYAAMNADERLNYAQRRVWSGGREIEPLGVPEADLARIAPVDYLERITAAVSIHHSTDDATVPVEWSDTLCARLGELGKDVECFTYSGVPHTFSGALDAEFMERYIAFFDRYLKLPDA